MQTSGFSLPQRTSSTADWADMLHQHFVALDVRDTESEQFTGAVRSHSLAHLQVSSVQSRTQRIERSGSLIRGDTRAYLQLGMMRRGTAVVRQDGREALVGRGDYVLYETSRPFDWMVNGDAADDQWVLEVFTWPRSMISLGVDESRGLTARTFDGASGMTGVLGRFLHDIVTARPEVDLSMGGSVADEVADLVSVIAHTIVTGDDLRQNVGLSRKIDQYIDQHLGDPDLSPTMIAQATSISNRQLHRIFADRDLTVSRTIRMKRLESCRREIIASIAKDRSLTEISRKWGFTDLAVFGRAFKDVYGVSPRQYRAAASAASNDPRAVTRPRRTHDIE